MDSWDIIVDAKDVHVDVHVDDNDVLIDVNDDVHAVHVNAPDGGYHSWPDPESYRFLSLLRADIWYFQIVQVWGASDEQF